MASLSSVIGPKFCLVRTGRLALSWWRYPLRRRDQERARAAPFPTPMAIGEVPMKRQWQVRRRMRPAADGARRWDRAYLLILSWSRADDQPAASVPGTSSQRAQEVSHEAVAVYVRVSTQRQAQAQTIEQQLERLRAHLRGQGDGADERGHLPR